MTIKIGLDVAHTFVASTADGYDNPPHVVGTRAMDDKTGKEYVFVKASAAIAASDVVTFDETYATVVAPITTTNGARGDHVGVAPVAIASGAWGWVQIFGPCTMNVLASCAANVRVNTTATAGSPDDDGTATTKQIEGIYLTAARGGTNGSAAGILDYPEVGVTL